MTIRIPLLLATVVALHSMTIAQVMHKPQDMPDKTSESDRARVKEVMSQSVAAYRNLHSYSGRFSTYDPNISTSQRGTIQFERPNRAAVRVLINGKYTRRTVSDGHYRWTADSRFPGQYIRAKIEAKEDNVAGSIFECLYSFYRDRPGRREDNLKDFYVMRIHTLLSGDSPFDFALLRLTSPLGAPTLDMYVYVTQYTEGEFPEIWDQHRAPIRFRFGPDSLLRGYIEPTQSPPDAYERHWDIQLNTQLPAETFQFKPARGAREVAWFDMDEDKDRP